MALPTAKSDLSSLHPIQRSLHYPSYDGEEIRSAFLRDEDKMTWFTHSMVKMAPSDTATVKDGIREITYKVNNQFHELAYSILCQSLPAIQVKPAYEKTVRIAWSKCSAFAIMELGEFRINDDVPQSIDRHWCYIHTQNYIKNPSKRDRVMRRAGNEPFLINWTTSLPAFTTSYILPFYYSRDLSQAVELFLNPNIVYSHHFHFKAAISDLLRMEQLIEGRWTPCPVDFSFLNGIPSDGMLKAPEMWGRYILLTPIEVEDRKKMPRRTIWIEDIASIRSENPEKFNQNVTVEIDSQTPCKAIHWMAENVQSVEMNNFFNYTTNSEDSSLGWNPISSVTLVQGGNTRFKNIPAHLFEMEGIYHLPSVSDAQGLGVHTLAWNPDNIGTDISKVIKGKLTFTLSDFNPYHQNITERTLEDVPEESASVQIAQVSDKKQLFVIHVLMLVIRKLSYTLNPESKQFEFSLDIPDSDLDPIV